MLVVSVVEILEVSVVENLVVSVAEIRVVSVARCCHGEPDDADEPMALAPRSRQGDGAPRSEGRV